jgi:hypothetical protein
MAGRCQGCLGLAQGDNKLDGTPLPSPPPRRCLRFDAAAAVELGGCQVLVRWFLGGVSGCARLLPVEAMRMLQGAGHCLGRVRAAGMC